MNVVVTDELRLIDEAFSRNRLLSTFTPEARALLEPFATPVTLDRDDVIQDCGAHVTSTYFPFATTMVSLVVDLDEGCSVEVASIGHEGAVGGIVSCGHAPAFARAQVLIDGPALRVPMSAIEDAKMRSGHIRNLFCRFSDYLLSQVMQSVACNTYHPIEKRAARWLLTAQDRAGDRIVLTQEGLAGLLGVQRTTVNAVVGALQDERLIMTRRGAIQVTDRTGLKRRSCHCYEAVERHFAQVIGASGGGGSDCA